MQDSKDIHFTPRSSYTILHFDYGIVIRGYMPAVDFYDLQKVYCYRYGYNHSDDGIAKYFKATLCLTTVEMAKKWQRILNIVEEVETYSYKNQYRKIENVSYIRRRASSI